MPHSVVFLDDDHGLVPRKARSIAGRFCTVEVVRPRVIPVESTHSETVSCSDGG